MLLGVIVNTVIPDSLKWTLPSLSLDTSSTAKRGLSKINNRLATCNSVDPDETHHENIPI